jgi:redox-sensing transcriptional repressor
MYLRFLEGLESGQRETVSSSQLARSLGLTAAQVRRDLAYFGQFGFPGVGYKVANLVHELKRILGTDKTWHVALVGAGNLGTALLRYRGFRKQGFEIAAVFDADPKLEGKVISGLTIRSTKDMAKVIRESRIRIAILAVPAEAAEEAAAQCVAAGVHGILNFAPTRLSVPDSVIVHPVDLALQLEQLAFRMRLEGRPESPRSAASG